MPLDACKKCGKETKILGTEPFLIGTLASPGGFLQKSLIPNHAQKLKLSCIGPGF